MKKTYLWGLFSILLTLSIVGYTAHLQKKIILNEAKVNISNLTNSVEMDLERSFFGLNQLFLGLENYLELQSTNGFTDDPAVRRVLDDLLLENPFLTALSVLDGDGQVLHWNNNFQKPNLEQRDYFQVHKKKNLEGLYIGMPQESILNKGQWIFGISKAFRDSNGNLDKVIAAIVNVNHLYRRYEKLFTSAKVELTIFSPQGDIYTRIPDHHTYAGKRDPHYKKKIQIASNSSEVQYHPDSGGNMHIAAIHKVNPYPLYISVIETEEDVLSHWQSEGWIYALLGVCVSLALLFLTYRTAQTQRSQLKLMEELQLQAISDPLTKLANRRYVLEQSELEIKKAQRMKVPLSVIMLDLDHFKRVNDNCGHLVGDKVLEEIAQLVKQACRETDIISRFGGEEFLLLLPGTDLDGAVSNANKIRETVEKHTFSGPGGEFRVTVSLGVTQWVEGETEISGALRRADTALYEAKDAGRNTVMKSSMRSKKDNVQNLFWLDKSS